MKNSMSLVKSNALRQNQEKRGKLLKMKAKNIDQSFTRETKIGLK